jgi:hypothetical protein
MSEGAQVKILNGRRAGEVHRIADDLGCGLFRILINGTPHLYGDWELEAVK